MTKVFVYGTLLSGERNNHILLGSDKRGEEVVYGYFMINIGAFPACIKCDNCSNAIFGEVWEVDDETFSRLDMLEGYPRLYTRELVETFDGNAWIYVWNKDNGLDFPVIPSGNWREK